MYEIINKQVIGNDIKRIEVAAQDIARKIKPGQFVMVMPDGKSGKIPLAVADTDPDKGLITLIFQEIGLPTKTLGALKIGDPVFSVLGPLGLPAPIERIGTVVCIGQGVGIAQVFPVSKAFRQASNRVIGIVGAKTKRSLILESQMRLTCYKLYLTTEDGSHGQRGFTEDVLSQVVKEEKVELVYCVGSPALLETVTDITRSIKIKTLVSLNPFMVDGTGLCGSCRVKVGGKQLLACTDGPVFDGHQVDFKDLILRTNSRSYEQ